MFPSEEDKAFKYIVMQIVSNRWSSSDYMVNGFENVAVGIFLESAKLDNSLKQVGDNLFALSVALQGDSLLRDSLSNEKRSLDARLALVNELLEGKVHRVALCLARLGVQSLKRYRYLAMINWLIKQVAEKRNKLVATVRTSCELSEAQSSELESKLKEKYNQDIQMNIVVDPDITGGMRLQVDSNVLDWTIDSQFESIRRDFNSI
jgi:F-type H+-transporting ATPase subunit delta